MVQPNGRTDAVFPLRAVRTLAAVHKRFYALLQYEGVQPVRGCDAPSRIGTNAPVRGARTAPTARSASWFDGGGARARAQEEQLQQMSVYVDFDVPADLERLDGVVLEVRRNVEIYVH